MHVRRHISEAGAHIPTQYTSSYVHSCSQLVMCIYCVALKHTERSVKFLAVVILSTTFLV